MFVSPDAELVPPAFKLLPERDFSRQFLEARLAVFELIEPYYDRDHLTRAGDWMLALNPDAPEHLVLAALTHDLERQIPGGPKLDITNDPWDDEIYNRLHCERSAELVPGILRECGAGEDLAEAVRRPIREHEFGGSPEGDLMQAADSLSFLEVNAALCASWVGREMCTRAKGLDKLKWMCSRIRLDRAQATAQWLLRLAVAEFYRRLGASPKVEAHT